MFDQPILLLYADPPGAALRNGNSVFSPEAEQSQILSAFSEDRKVRVVSCEQKLSPRLWEPKFLDDELCNEHMISEAHFAIILAGPPYVAGLDRTRVAIRRPRLKEQMGPPLRFGTRSDVLCSPSQIGTLEAAATFRSALLARHSLSRQGQIGCIAVPRSDSLPTGPPECSGLDGQLSGRSRTGWGTGSVDDLRNGSATPQSPGKPHRRFSAKAGPVAKHEARPRR